jgi:hypothetical protein
MAPGYTSVHKVARQIRKFEEGIPSDEHDERVKRVWGTYAFRVLKSQPLYPYGYEKCNERTREDYDKLRQAALL